VNEHDYIIVGGGLQGGLIALTLRQIQPHARVMLIERGPRPAGNHTWSFHAADLPAESEPIVRPLIVGKWSGYWVKFPDYSCNVASAYASISSEFFADALETCGCDLLTNTIATAIAPNRVQLADGSELAARCVIDARGPEAAEVPSGTGYQKFVGLEIETERPWPETLPTVMDATVPQTDGYRFVYTLPFTPHRILIEDTYFADGNALDYAVLRQRVEDVIVAANIGTWRILREESGVLPMPWAGAGISGNASGLLVTGYAGGWFHPATGYSFPLAVRLALAIANCSPDRAHMAAKSLARKIVPRQQFARLLNRLLFTVVVPSERWQVFRRLYRSLPDSLLNRFYALEFGAIDAARLLVGWPPPLALSRLIHRPEP